ncbi:RNA-guided endonuclease TnpB family protein [Okeania sp. KiyG1]|uniref:RNA-guided endonuclease InsQ/TnpB family protein n=1 Tax=Okeania sp. KiyG1 TaxID=2720165 RepID=UPI0019213CA4|nr:RNA-guided endonuclease TnpB family protein [Okeania sp. KiyG1]GGA32055.1 transposase [Okeania sp. KiyG1]GGA41148.1 transposase [Okeania sp. KiyG1]GGA44112.1 transposase [Okeania sp. KiyG1]
MLIYEMKLQGTQGQYNQLDSAIRTGRFVRNSIIRAWIDREVKSRNDAYKYCTKLAHNPKFPWAKQLNSMARQAHAERAWAAIERFYQNCKANVAGKKGFPKFKKYQIRDSVEYKTSGWKLSEDRRYLTFTDGFKAGTFKLWGSRNLHFYQINQIKRVRVVRRYDGYYAQFSIDHTREEKKNLTGTQLGIDLGLNHFYTDSAGEKVDNPRFLRQGERKIKKLQRRLSRTQKGSQNRSKARNRLGRAHLKVSRRRNDWAVKLAQRVIQSNDLVAIENLKVRNMMKNHKLAKSIADAAWYRFREWLEYFGRVYGVPVVTVEPAYTSVNCSSCGEKVVKTLSTRTHQCPHCGYVADRDENAAINILQSALRELATTLGHRESHASGENDLCLVEETQASKPTRGKRKVPQ